MKKRLATVILFCCLAWLTGEDGTFALDTAGVLGERANTFWDARVRQDWGVLYEFLSPSERDQATKERFVSQSKAKAPFRYLSYHLGEVETAGDLGWVKTEFEAKAVKFDRLPSRRVSQWQVWQKSNAEWCPLADGRSELAPGLPPRLRPAAEEARLLKRADEFWEAREKQHWGVVYEYCDPGFRQRVPAEEFLQMKAMNLYLLHALEWAEVAGDRGRVRITYRYRSSDPGLAKLDPDEISVVEDWVKVDDEWYRSVPEPQ